MRKYHEIFENSYTRKIAFISRSINFLEDILEDSECENVYATIREDVVLVEGVNCNYDIKESIEVFSEKYDIYAEIGNGEQPLSSLYREVIDTYSKTLHFMMKNYAGKSIATGKEYFLAILFNGKAFILEGEKNSVIVPGISHCFSAHTHPSQVPIPSKADLKTITNLFIDRGIGHVIETVGTSMAIYRTAPLTIDELEYIKELEKLSDPVKILSLLTQKTNITIKYI